jgi:hypothetical protein
MLVQAFCQFITRMADGVFVPANSIKNIALVHGKKIPLTIANQGKRVERSGELSNFFKEDLSIIEAMSINTPGVT